MAQWIKFQTISQKRDEALNMLKKSSNSPKLSNKIFSKAYQGINVDTNDCLFTRKRIYDDFSASLINSQFIPFSEIGLKLFHFLWFYNSLLRNRTWRHRSSESRNGQYRAWSIRHWKPFGFTWSRINDVVELEWHDFFLKKNKQI